MSAAWRWTSLASASLCAIACQAARPMSAEDDVRRALDALIEADNRRDLDAVADSYTEDVELVPPAGDALHGKAAVRARYAEIFAAWLPELHIEHERTIVEGERARDTGRTFGTLRATAGDAIRAVDDGYEAVLRLEGGRWRVERLSWWPATARL